MSPELDAVLAYGRTLAPSDRMTIRVGILCELAELVANAGGEVARLLTTADLARRYSVAESTARGWLAQGLAPGAEKLAGLGWRCPPDALPALEASLRESNDATDLGAWRRMRRPDRGAA